MRIRLLGTVATVPDNVMTDYLGDGGGVVITFGFSGET
jgi:hypothetical protein